jgi:hypothetical protein
VDRPGGVVHSDRELRIVAPNTGDAKADEAAAVAIEFGVLRGLLDLTTPAARKGAQKIDAVAVTKHSAEAATDNGDKGQSAAPNQGAKKKWWMFGLALLVIFCGAVSSAPVPKVSVTPHRTRRVDTGGDVKIAGPLRVTAVEMRVQGLGAPNPTYDCKNHTAKSRCATLAAIVPAAMETHRLKYALLAAEPAQGQFATGQGQKITDGTNFLVVDPCKAQTKSYASISQTASAQLVAGTASKKIYVCSIHVVVAAATNIAVVEGTGTTCGTGTAGVGGFGGATAATGWNFAANGGIALGNGDSSLGAEVTSGDNLCIFNSGSGQVSGGISYVVE